MNPNATGNWVITNGKDQFYNPRNGKWEDFFTPSKHLFHEWRKVLWKLHFFCWKDPDVRVEKVELNPSFIPVAVDPKEIEDTRVNRWQNGR